MATICIQVAGRPSLLGVPPRYKYRKLPPSPIYITEERGEGGGRKKSLIVKWFASVFRYKKVTVSHAAVS